MNSSFPFQNPSLPLEERLQDLVSRLSLDEKISLIPTMQSGVERLGIRPYGIGAEGAHGFVDRNGESTTFPQTLGLSSTWDRNLLHEIGNVIGNEARAYYNREKKHGLSLWFPTIDMEKDPRWGRTEEAYGEDPYLAGELASEIVLGTQGNDPFYIKASCGPKHFFANNNEKNRGSCSCSIDPRNMREYYLEPFRRVFQKGKPFSLMTAYNEVNGIPMMQHPSVRDIVKGEWKLEGRGHIVTDGGDVNATVNEHKYFSTHDKTIAAGFKNGADSMTDEPEMVINAVRQALSNSLITEEELDYHLENILRVRFRYGHFDPEGVCPYDALGENNMMTREAKELSREAVRKSAVLLKNESVNGRPLLPVEKPKTKKIALLGPLADEVHTDWYTGNPSYKVTAYDALKKEFGEQNISYESGSNHISFYTKEGRPLILDADNRLCTVPEGTSFVPFTGAEVFRRDDWGWGANTLYSLSKKKFLNTSTAMSADHQPSAEEVEQFKQHKAAYKICADADSVWNWFIMTLYNIVPANTQNSGSKQAVYLKIWNGNSVKIQSNKKDLEAGSFEDPDLFYMITEFNALERAEKIAKEADLVFVFLGNQPLINGKEEMDRPSLDLPSSQKNLLTAAHKANPNTALILCASYPYTITKENESIPAILYSSHGMQEYGNGITEILLGKSSPAGRLSLTWYKSVSHLPPMMEYDIISSNNTYQYNTQEVLYPFGHGLTYTKFTYENLILSSAKTKDGKPVLSGTSPVTVSFTLTNSGNTDSDEVPQMYISITGSRIKRPLKTLRGFDRIFIKAGESKNVEFILNAEDTHIWDVTREKFCVENGFCTVSIGASSSNISLSGIVEIEGETIPPRNIFMKTLAQNYDSYSLCYLHEKRGSDIPCVFNKEDGAWISFADCAFSGSGAKTCTVHICTNGCTSLEVRTQSPDGPLLGQCTLPNTGDNCAVPWNHVRPVWTDFSFPLEKEISGIHTIFFILKGTIGIQSFIFS